MNYIDPDKYRAFNYSFWIFNEKSDNNMKTLTL